VRGITAAKERGWPVVSMHDDFKGGVRLWTAAGSGAPAGLRSDRWDTGIEGGRVLDPRSRLREGAA
jgi:hypothetical protein